MKKLAILFMVFSFFNLTTMAQALDWAKSMGGTDWDAGTDIAVDSSGNVYTTGWFRGTVDFDPSAGIFNLSAGEGFAIFIQKLDSIGNLVWAKSMGYLTPGGGGYGFGLGITVDASGNIYTTGFFAGTVDFDPNAGVFNLTTLSPTGEGPTLEMFVQKLDANGNFIWAKSTKGDFNSIPSTSAQSITVDASGNVYTTGMFTGMVDFDPNAGVFNLTGSGLIDFDVFIQKLDADGNFLWAKSMGNDSPGFDSHEIGSSISVDGSGNVYTTGEFWGTVDFNPNAGTFNLTAVDSSDIFIQKLDEGGNFIWAKSMGGTQLAGGSSIALDSSGNIYTTGGFRGTVDFDPNAGTFNLTAVDSSDIFIQKLDAGGNFLWAKSMGGTQPSGGGGSGHGIAVDASGNVYTTGTFAGTVDFDPNAGTFNLTAVDSSDIFIQKLDAQGNFIWAKSMGGTQSSVGTSIALDGSRNVYTTGWFTGTVDFDPNGGTLNLTSSGSWDIFVHKLAGSTCDTPANYFLFETDITQTSAALQFNLTGYQLYDWRYRVVGTSTWTNLSSTTSPSKFVSGLSACTDYEWQVNLQCSNSEWTGWFGMGDFTTTCQSNCPIPGNYFLFETDITQSSAALQFNLTGYQLYDWRYKVAGTSTWTNLSTTTTPSKFVSGLSVCTDYEWQVNLQCSNSEWTGWFGMGQFMTECPGTCNAPANYSLFEISITHSSATLKFNKTGYQLYDWRYRVAGSNPWTELSTTTVPSKFVSGLSECTNYQWQVNLQCSNDEWTGWLGLGQFVTGCPDSSTIFTVNSAIVNSCQEEVCIPISVSNFVDIIGFQFSIHYDDSLLEFVDVNGFNVPNFDIGNFGLLYASDGRITVSWFDPDVSGVTLIDGTGMFQICFNVTGNNGDTANIFFNGTPTSIEVVNANQMTIPPVLIPGTVSILSPDISLSPTVMPSTCLANNGSIDLMISGGVPPYSIIWNNGATTEDIYNLSPGLYTPTITDANGCEFVGDAIEVGSVASSVSISATTTNVSCNGNEDGSIDLSIAGGTPPYSFEWMPNQGSSTEDLINLSPNIYTVTVTDANGCTSVASSVISEPAALSVSGVVTHQNVGNDGAIDVSVYGGTPPYVFVWSPGQGNTGNPIGLAPDTYYLTVTDGNGCTKTSSYTVNEADAPTFTSSVVNVLCNGGNNGEINVTIINGVPPFTYSWAGPIDPAPSGSNPTDLIAGTYMVTVTDGNGNTSVSQPITVAEPTPISYMSSVVNAACGGGADGEIHLAISGGSPPYSVLWSNGDEGMDLTGLMAGVYVPTITDANNCLHQGNPVTIVELNVAPTDYLLTTSSITQSGAILQIDLGGYQTYDWRYREVGTNTWQSANSSSIPNQSISGLSPCTAYEWQVNLQCAGGMWTGWFGAGSFSTECLPILTFGNFYQFAEEGETIEIPVLLEGFGNLIDFQFSINWDTSYLNFSGIQSVQSDLENFSITNIDDQPVLTEAGMLSASWSNLSNPNYILEPITQLFTFQLKARNSICDTTIVDFASVPLSVEFFNKNFELLAVEYAGREIFLNADNCLTAAGYIRNDFLVDIFPNPASNEFYLYSAIDVEDLIIRDFTGSVIRRYNAPQSGIDISDLSRGIYLIEIISDKFRVMKKLIKV